MSTYYDYYLEQKTSEGWVLIKSPDFEYDCIHSHTGLHGDDSFQNYKQSDIPLEETRIEVYHKYKEEYEKSKLDRNRFSHYYPYYCLMDLDEMITDYDSNIHEYDGIISKNDLLKLERDCDYEPKIYEPNDINNLIPELQQNYVYHCWDSNWSDYKIIYQIVPRVKKVLAEHNLNLDDIRLTCDIC